MAWSGRKFFTRSPILQQQEEALAYLPCAPGCRGSDSDPRFCRCVCRGINHGLLLRPVQFQTERPVPVPYGYNPMIPLQQVPELEDLSSREKGIERFEAELNRPDPRPFSERHKTTVRVSRKLAKSLFNKRASETELNQEILSGLRKQFSEERVNAIVDEAFTEHYSRVPDSNRPELYELYESGYVDNVLERRNIRWVIGRPKHK